MILISFRNILLHNGNIKLCDFGISHLKEDPDTPGTTNDARGTLPYTAPEILNSSEETKIDKSADVWYFNKSNLIHLIIKFLKRSAGCIIFEMVKLKRLFIHASSMDFNFENIKLEIEIEIIRDLLEK